VIRTAYGISYIHFNRIGRRNLLLTHRQPLDRPAVLINQTPAAGVYAANQDRNLLPADAAGLSREPH